MENRALLVVSACLLCLLLLPDSAFSRTWRVRQDATGDTPYVDYAVYLAQAGDTILVGPGTYLQPPIFLKAVHLISETGPRATILSLYPLDAEIDVHVIVIEAVSSCSVIGFTIRGGRNGWLSAGGGILCIDSHAAIKDNIVTDNWCASGGGLACYGFPAPVIEGNLFCGNGAFGGAAVTISNCSPIIRNNTIVDNHASDAAGAVYIVGDQSAPEITDNILANNSAATLGAIYSDTPASQVILSCNDAWSNTPSNYGGTLADQTGSFGNISADPVFCGVGGSGNYYLQTDSPCSEEHAPAYCGGLRMGCYPVKCTMDVKKKSWGSIRALFKGEGK